jgi:hypothetical protein
MKRLALIIAFTLLTAGISNAFVFQVQNNLDEKAIYHLYRVDHQVKEFLGPIPQAGGEVAAKSSIQIAKNCQPGIYFFEWWSGDLKNEKEIEVDSSVTRPVIIELNYPQIEIEVSK